MSLSFIDIEEQKSHLIAFLFLFLIFFYFFIAWFIAIPVKAFLLACISRSSFLKGHHSILPNLKESLVIIMIAILAGVGHWYTSLKNIIEKIPYRIGAKRLDEDDTFHRRFKNIVDEASLTIGGREIECYIVPTHACNAFALADFKRHCVIGVTEGLLANLNRSQLEAVVAHELAHIVIGDCLMTSVAASLFGVYSACMNKIKNNLKEIGRNSLDIFILLIGIYIVLAITRFMGIMLNLFISREREYRADAIAARLNRNPLALAEAIYLISRKWRGMNLTNEYLSSIFIINPKKNIMDESEGFFADLFSSHPPVRRRIEILLDLAHMDMRDMVEELERKRKIFKKSPSSVAEVEIKPDKWFLVNPEYKWDGPFSLDEIRKFSWLKAETWVRKETESNINFARDDKQLRNIFEDKQDNRPGIFCPECLRPLKETLYEGVPILRCKNCNGYLINTKDKILRIITRKEHGISEEAMRMAQVIKSYQKGYNRKIANFLPTESFTCPVCHQKMKRRFYSFVFPIEIDSCINCEAIWFGKKEIEILQYLIEQAESDI